MKKKTITKTLGRFFRWTAYFILLYMVVTNIHVKLELNRPNGLEEMVGKASTFARVIGFIRNF